MKITYTNKPLNKQKNSSASLKTILLMSFVVASMITIKFIYSPTDATEDMAAMAEISAEAIDSEIENSFDIHTGNT